MKKFKKISKYALNISTTANALLGDKVITKTKGE